MKIKKISAIIATAIMTVSLVSCVTNNGVSNSGSTKPSSNSTISNSIPTTGTIVVPTTTAPTTGTIVVPTTTTPTTGTIVVPTTTTPTTGTIVVPTTTTPTTRPTVVPSTTTSAISGSVVITEYSGHLESAHVEWCKDSAVTDYNVYYKKTTDSTYKAIDKMLIREYQNYYRADVLGLAAGDYNVKIVPIQNNIAKEELASTVSVNVLAHERTGYAFLNGSSSGAYNDDGTLKNNAAVLYVTNANKDKIKYTINGTEYTGLQNIITAQKKGTNPLCIRFIGNITDPSTLSSGDLEIKEITSGITFEGVGDDATINGFGFKIVKVSNCEVRNLGFMNCDSGEGDNISLNSSNEYVWIHNNDLFYGNAGSDADQAKGDGALDTKTSTNITHSYNHFWDSGKCNLQGMKSETIENKITYHHNWYDHSDSRHPRVRTCTVHVYNNFYDGVSKYGIGATMGASIFSENNYFLNTKNPILASSQGTDALGEGTFSGETGGIVKSYGDFMTGTSSDSITYQENNTSFDFYQASSRNEIVPSTVVTLLGGTKYSNFDTASDFYSYTVDTPEVAKDKVIKYSGRVSGGDFKWTFDDSENTNYGVITELKKALSSYKSSLIRVLGTEDSIIDDSTNDDTIDTPVIQGTITHNFENGKDSEYFTISGSMKDATFAVEYNGVTYTKGLKMESSTSITFDIESQMTLVLVISDATKKIKIDGQSYTSISNVVTINLEAGSHTITKGETTNLLAIILS